MPSAKLWGLLGPADARLSFDNGVARMPQVKGAGR